MHYQQYRYLKGKKLQICFLIYLNYYYFYYGFYICL